MEGIKVEEVLKPEEEQIKIEQEISLQKRFETFDWKFETYGDQTLIKMLDFTKQFVNHIEYQPRWLTFSGPTEIGKTYLLQRVYQLTKGLDLKIPTKTFGFPNVIYKKWYDITRDIFNKQEDNFTPLQECGLLIIEEFLCKDLQSSNAFDKIILDHAHQLLDSRLGKPTLLDTNKTMQEIEALDIRIASRLKRGSSRFVSINKNTTIYSNREPCI